MLLFIRIGFLVRSSSFSSHIAISIPLTNTLIPLASNIIIRRNLIQQVHSDAKKHPIENGRALWCEITAPYVDMGTLVFDGGNPDDGADVTEASKVREYVKTGFTHTNGIRGESAMGGRFGQDVCTSIGVEVSSPSSLP